MILRLAIEPFTLNLIDQNYARCQLSREGGRGSITRILLNRTLDANFGDVDFMNELGSMFAIFFPLIFIYWLANQAERNRLEGKEAGGLAVFSYILVIGFYLFMILIGLALQLIIRIARTQPEVFAEIEGMPIDPAALATDLASAPLLAFGIWLPSLIGILLLTPALRRVVAGFADMDFDAASPVHAISISLSMLIFVNLAATLGVGLENLGEMMENAQATSGQEPNLLLSLWLQQILTAVLAIFGVGWLSRLNWGKTMERLGIVRPTMNQVLLGVGLGLALIPIVIGVEYVTSLFGFGSNAEVEALTEQLLGGLFETPLGIITLGAAAALGEETLFRGAAQPRFGLILTSILFAILHSNYGLTFSTAIVFGLGLVLGWVRIQHNTTTAMIVHAVYNSSLGLLAYLGSQFMEF